MRFSCLVVIPIMLALMSCQSGPLPSELMANKPRTPEGSVPPKALFDAGWQTLPIGSRSGATIGVVGMSENGDSATLLIMSASSSRRVFFHLESGRWYPDTTVRKDAAGPALDPPLPDAWGGPVAQLYDQSHNVIGVFTSSPGWAGYYQAAGHSESGNVFGGKCNQGSEPVGDGSVSLHCGVWELARNIYPVGSGGCPVADCRWEFTNHYDPNDTKVYGATDVTLNYFILTPLHLDMTPPTEPITSSGTYNWTANVNGGDGQSYTFDWFYGTDGTTWSEVAHTRSYSRTLGPGASSFYLKVIVGSPTGSKALVHQVAVNIPLPPPPPPLSATISGPTNITTKATYSWTVTAAGGTPPYAYQWVVDYASGVSITLGTQTSQSLTVFGDDGSFYIKVTAVGGASVTDSVLVRNCITSCTVLQ